MVTPYLEASASSRFALRPAVGACLEAPYLEASASSRFALRLAVGACLEAPYLEASASGSHREGPCSNPQRGGWAKEYPAWL